MGDRAYVSINVLDHDAGRLCDILRDEPEEKEPIGTNGWIRMGFPECAADSEEERKEAAQEGVMFYGYHCAGDNYPAALFASNGDGELYRVAGLASQYGVDPVVVVSMKGDPVDLMRARTVLAVYRSVKGEALEVSDDLDFGEKLESSLASDDNAGVIDELGLHDPENMDLILDYIRNMKGGDDGRA